ncbi:TPA: hypothetical protein N0F65_004344 [Lagenidium giganteum]|uniref:START-like domain n=1 Tax=Lagenidium giganteum TaxID=4803 RepID=A0AAV2YMM7_9STRA|nr:TPA: hypothetical protein N0F65_004344 [Lagenidium giganteum]
MPRTSSYPPPPRSPFPPLELSEYEEVRYQELLDEIVNEAIDEYHDYTQTCGGRVDARRWKLLKRREALTMYKERSDYVHEYPRLLDQETITSPASSTDTFSVRDSGGSARLGSSILTASSTPLILSVGSIVGTLEDAMLGVFADSTAALRLKYSYGKDHVEDCAMLSRIAGPTEQDPFRFVGIQWFMNELQGLNALARKRDFLMLTSTGITTTKAGKRIGYYVNHSMTHRAVPPDAKRAVVRGKISCCCLYQQVDSNRVQVFMQAYIEPNGHMIDHFAVKGYAASLFAIGSVSHCAQMKKLHWLLRHRDALRRNTNVTDPSQCSTCCKPLTRKLFGSSPCRCTMCGLQACGRCTIAKKLTVDTSISKVVQKPLPICVSCMLAVAQFPAHKVARAQADESERTHKARANSEQLTPKSMTSEDYAVC